eukprot:TRINITY_DN2895_c0_g1_i6.p1 TRINITY_DN2895_c0_g1~~TRINITY_DN2895_c0_g1_i6.p1  ORF type:complete len:139 (-),score=36.73 TRINITY_DN2895_c0_g1_i6:54-470(-)
MGFGDGATSSLADIVCFSSEKLRRATMDEDYKRLRDFFEAGGTMSYEYRLKQLNAILKALAELEGDFVEALKLDLGRPHMESFLSVASAVNEANAAIYNLRSWMAPQVVPTPLALMPGKSEIRKEPLGIVSRNVAFLI